MPLLLSKQDPRVAEVCPPCGGEEVQLLSLPQDHRRGLGGRGCTPTCRGDGATGPPAGGSPPPSLPRHASSQPPAPSQAPQTQGVPVLREHWVDGLPWPMSCRRISPGARVSAGSGFPASRDSSRPLPSSSCRFLAGSWRGLWPHQRPPALWGVPALSPLGLQSSEPLVDLGVPPAWRRRGWTHLSLLLLCAGVSVPLRWALGRRRSPGHAWAHSARTAQLLLEGKAGCPLSPESSWCPHGCVGSPPVPTVTTSHGHWTRRGGLEPKGS